MVSVFGQAGSVTDGGRTELTLDIVTVYKTICHIKSFDFLQSEFCV